MTLREKLMNITGKTIPVNLPTDKIKHNFYDTVTITGKKSAGKSFLINVIIRDINRYIIWDARYERISRKMARQTKTISEKAIIINDSSIKVTSNIADIGKYDKIIFHPYAKDKKHLIEIFNSLCDAIYKTKDYVFVIEEADTVADRYRPLPSALFELVQGNIHRNVGLYFLARRPQNLHPDIVRLSDHFYIFKYSRKDKEYIESVTGEGLADQIPSRAFYHYNGDEMVYYEDGIQI